MNKTDAVLAEVARERERQELRRAGKFMWTCADSAQPNTRKLTVLAEEFGEASREVCDEMIAQDKGNAVDAALSRKRLREELIQVAAVAVAWAEGLTD